VSREPLAFVGGTGKQGRGLALRLAAAGHPIVIGSRESERATATAAGLADDLRRASFALPPRLEGMTNAAAVEQAEIVFLALPFGAVDEFFAAGGCALAGKLVVDVVNPLRLVAGRFEIVPLPEGSAACRIARLAPDARIVAAFKNAPADDLLEIPKPVAGDVLIAGADADCKRRVAELTREIPNLRPVDAGPLANAALLEAVTALELNLNRLHRKRTAIQILGL
jgi:8-hydroxy-5-deazaflavin:NADPH oxidoreductase